MLALKRSNKRCLAECPEPSRANQHVFLAPLAHLYFLFLDCFASIMIHTIRAEFLFVTKRKEKKHQYCQ